jgi:hydrogenase/urease accessory protein HupE
MSGAALRRLGAWFALLLLMPLAAAAHEIRPAYLEITEDAGKHVHVLWKMPTVGRLSVPLDPKLSSGWLDRDPASTSETDVYLIRQWDIAPPHVPLDGQTVTIEGLDQTITDVLTRISFANGVAVTHLIHPEHPTLVVPNSEKPTLPIVEYLELGLTHIWTGVDHLLYVFGLMLLVGNFKSLLKTITAFTVAHSITLAAAALQVIHVRPAPVEAVIALSIVYVAVELVHLRQGKPGLAYRYPWLVAFSFGLLHGLGFAGALAQIGLPPHDIPLALFLFNVGIEAGQVSFVLAVLALGWLLRRLVPAVTRKLEWLPPYAIGSMAAFWLIERTLVFI